MCVVCFYIVEAPRPGVSHSMPNKTGRIYVNRNALSMFKALIKGCKKGAVEGRLKSLKIQHRIFS